MNDTQITAGRILWLLSGLLLLMAGATLAFMRSEGLAFLDALYLTTETLSTVGYGNIAPGTTEGKLFSILLMVVAATVGLTAAGLLVAYVVEGRMTRFFGERKMTRLIEKMSQHIILCGYGAMGRRVAATLQRSGIPFVIVERDPAAAQEARDADLLVIEGDATREEILEQAGLARARGLLTVIGDDAENLYISMTVRERRPELPIVCRIVSERAVSHLHRAGIQHLISPEEMGARRMVQQLLRPEVVDFLDLMFAPGTSGTGLEAYRIPEGCPLVGRELRGSGMRERFGLFIVALRRGASYLPNPHPSEILRAGDVLILVGTEESLARFRDEMAPAQRTAG